MGFIRSIKSTQAKFLSPWVFLFIVMISVSSAFLLHFLLEPSLIVEHLLIDFCIAVLLYVFIYRPSKINFLELDKIREELRKSNESLENQVSQRTEELLNLNMLLQEEHVEALRLSEENYKQILDGLGV